MNKNRNFELTGAPEDTGEDFEAAAFAALLEDMAGKARFLAEALDILAEIGMEPDDTGCEPGPAEDMEAEPETDLFLISGGSFRLLAGTCSSGTSPWKNGWRRRKRKRISEKSKRTPPGMSG